MRGATTPLATLTCFRFPRQGPACTLCRKQFTSAAQLEEHKLGKWHQMRLRGELPPARA
jgi:hypothetical protein